MRRDELTRLMRENIRNLVPYSTARDEYQGELGIFLDANESPYGREGLNRYPSRNLRETLLSRLAEYRGVPREMLFIGNGSDESIDLCYRVFCEPGVNNAVMIAPSYGMYSVCADINGVQRRQVQLNEDFSLPVDSLLEACDDSTRLMFICSPNNPTGNAFPENDIRRVLEAFSGIVVLDEAYVDFSSGGSMRGLLAEYPKLVILQTLSKACGLAGLRIGMTIAHPEIISVFDKVRYPYNVGTDTLRLALEKLDPERINAQTKEIVSQRPILCSRLEAFGCVEKVFPSEANFLLARVKDPSGLYDHLIKDGIIVRNRSTVRGCEGTLRLTIGTPQENEPLIKSIYEYENPGK